MEPLPINTHDRASQKGGATQLLKTLDKVASPESQAAQDGSFAGMLKRKKSLDTAPAPVPDKTEPSAISPGIQSISTGEAIATDHSLQKAPTNGAAFLFPLNENETPALLVDEPTPLKFFVEAPASDPTRAASEKTAHPRPSASVAAYAHREGTDFSWINTAEEKSESPKHAPSQDQTVKMGGEKPSAPSEGPASPHAATQAGRRNEPIFINGVAAVLQKKQNGPSPEIILSEDRRTFFLKQDENRNTFPKTAAPATALEDGLRKETPLMERVAELLQARQGGLPPEGIDFQARRSVVSKRSNQTAAPLKAASPATTVQNPFLADAGDGKLAARMDGPEKEAGTMKEAQEKGMEPPDLSDRSRNSTPAHAATARERDAFPLRAESVSAPGPLEWKAPLPDSLPGNRTQAVINQISEARQAMHGDFGRIRIVLTPPNLGTVDLQIFMRKERVEVLMTTDNSSVQQALLSRADDIRSALQRQDLKIETFQVLLQDSGPGQQQANGGAMYEQRREGWKRLNVAEEHIPAKAVFPLMEGSGSATGQLNIFA